MGPKEKQPPLPKFEWAMLPPENRWQKKWHYGAKYFQGFEYFLFLLALFALAICVRDTDAALAYSLPCVAVPLVTTATVQVGR